MYSNSILIRMRAIVHMFIYWSPHCTVLCENLLEKSNSHILVVITQTAEYQLFFKKKKLWKRNIKNFSHLTVLLIEHNIGSFMGFASYSSKKIWAVPTVKPRFSAHLWKMGFLLLLFRESGTSCFFYCSPQKYSIPFGDILRRRHFAFLSLISLYYGPFALTSKMCSNERGMMPRWEGGSVTPCMEKLFPHPVCPYAKTVPL